MLQPFRTTPLVTPAPKTIIDVKTRREETFRSRKWIELPLTKTVVARIMIYIYMYPVLMLKTLVKDSGNLIPPIPTEKLRMCLKVETERGGGQRDGAPALQLSEAGGNLDALL